MTQLSPGFERFCLFVGHPRSGHSVLGTLLNGHRSALISHNLDALRYLRDGFGREEVFFLIRERDRWFAARKRSAGGYSYEVPGLWLGGYEDLRVIGDKRAGSASRHLGEDPSLLVGLSDSLAVPIFVIRHLRHPLDNISSMWTKRSHRRGRALSELGDEYFSLLDAADRGLAACGSKVRVLCTYHEDLIREPCSVLGRTLGFLGLDADESYLDACARYVHPEPRRTRRGAPWTPELTRRVAQRAAEHPLLSRYEFD